MPTTNDSPSGSPTPVEDLTYEQAFRELETVVSVLENEERNLEDALDLYERGQALANHCAELLDRAELRVQQLSGEDLEDMEFTG